MKNIYLVRHAEADFSDKNDFTRPLTEKGLIDSKKVTFFQRIGILINIYSSPFRCTIDTIRDFSKKINKEIFPVDNFKERKIGAWLENFNNFAYRQWNDFNYKLANGESLNEVQKRNLESFFNVLESPESNIVIATHGTALSSSCQLNQELGGLYFNMGSYQ